MADAITGAVTLSATGRQDERKPDIWSEIIKIDPNQNVFLSLLEGSLVGKKVSALPPQAVSTTDGGTFKWAEKRSLSYQTTVTAAATAAATDITVADSSMFTYGMLVQVDRNAAGDGEIMILDQDPSDGTTINVQSRGLMGTTAKAISVGARITAISPGTRPEFGVTSQIRSTVNKLTWRTNCCQAWEVKLESTFRRQGAKTWFGYEWPEDATEKLQDMKRLINRSFYFNGDADITTTDAGGGSTSGATGTPIWWLGEGLDGVINTNAAHTAGGNLTYDWLREFMGVMVRQRAGSTAVWVALASQRTVSHIGGWGMQYYNSEPEDDVFGMAPTQVKLPTLPNQSVLPFYWDPTLDLSYMENGFYLVPLTNIRLRYLQGGPPKNTNWNISAQDSNGIDVSEDGSTNAVAAFRACMGIQAEGEELFAKVRGCTPVVM